MFADWVESWRRPYTKYLVAFTAALLFLAYLIGPAPAETTRALQLSVPLDIVALTQVVFTGLAACGGVFATIYLPIVNGRQKRTELALVETNLKLVQAQLELSRVRDNVVLIERNTNSLTKQIADLSQTKGEQIGKEKERARIAQEAVTLAEGQRQGVESERASAASTSTQTLQPGKKPIDVADDRTAKAAERSANAQERTADATEEAAKK